MARALYAWLLRLHPPGFRRQFAAEMLGVFDDAIADTGQLPLLLDGLASLARQWILRSGWWWKVALALLGACLEAAGGMFWAVAGRGRPHSFSTPSGLGALMVYIIGSTGAVVAMVGGTLWWNRRFLQSRAGRGRTGR